eukprot:scaffold33262_cov63-Phaeocystis_antarctica.AAC.4
MRTARPILLGEGKGARGWLERSSNRIHAVHSRCSISGTIVATTAFSGPASPQLHRRHLRVHLEVVHEIVHDVSSANLGRISIARAPRAQRRRRGRLMGARGVAG